MLATLTAQVLARVGSRSDDELTGITPAGRRPASLADHQATVAVAEIARRRQAEYAAASRPGRLARRSRRRRFDTSAASSG